MTRSEDTVKNEEIPHVLLQLTAWLEVLDCDEGLLQAWHRGPHGVQDIGHGWNLCCSPYRAPVPSCPRFMFGAVADNVFYLSPLDPSLL
jgi:hypothetical protein